jgi:hypothetical protein
MEPWDSCGRRRGRPRVAFRFTITRGKIAGIDLLADRERLRRLDLTILSD